MTEFWAQPFSDKQGRLFAQSTDEAFAQLQVSKDDVQRWQQQDWISFDVNEMVELDEADCWEIEFVRDIIRSGLSDAQIEEFLSKLEKPYRFDPSKIAFNFSIGWRTLRNYDNFEFIDENVSDWITKLGEDQDIARLREIAAQITEQIEELKDD